MVLLNISYNLCVSGILAYFDHFTHFSFFAFPSLSLKKFFILTTPCLSTHSIFYIRTLHVNTQANFYFSPSTRSQPQTHIPQMSSPSNQSQSDNSNPQTANSTETQIVSLLPGLAQFDADLDDDEFCDPFASNKPDPSDKTTQINTSLVDDYDDVDDLDGLLFDDDGDDQALLLMELKKIKDEEEKEKQHQIKQELNNLNSTLHSAQYSSLFTNKLLANKMDSLVKQDLHIKGDSKDLQSDFNAAPVKRKKWTEDSVFSNTALGLGDSDMVKKQRLNNDTTNSDAHKQFLDEIFK